MNTQDLHPGGNFDVAYRQVDDFSSNTYTLPYPLFLMPHRLGRSGQIIKPLGSLTDE
jgi:hypothetical protein